MFKLPIILLFYLNCVYCYKQQQSNNDYGQHSQAPLPSLLKPKAIIHLPKNVYSHNVKDSITLDHNHLSNYLSSINYIPDTIHKHAQLLAQLNPEDIKKYGQSIDQNQLPLISLTVPDKNSEYSDAQQMKIDEYSSQQQDYAPQQNSGYQQQGGQEYNQPQQQQSYSQPPQQQSYSQPPSQSQEYSAPPPSPIKQKDCNQDKQGYNQQSDGGYQQEGGQDYANNGGYDGGSNENNDYNTENKSSEEYQQPPMENNYDTGNSYYAENNGGGGNSYENQGGKGYENQQTGGQSYGDNNNQNYDSNSNEGNSYSSENYESSPFDFNFVQDILQHVMAQLEQLQIDPDSLNTYGKVESNDGNYNSEGNGYESNDNANQGGYEVQGGANGIHLIDKPEGEEVNYGYSVNHGSYEMQPMNEKSIGYESNGGYASATSAQTTSYTSSSNEPAIVLDNKLPINKHKGQSTVTYQMPTINMELPKNQIEQIMKAISSKKGKYSQPIMIKSSHFKLPNNLNLGKIKTIAFIKSSKLNGLPGYFNTQLLGSNLNSLNNYKIVSSTSPSKKEETKYDRNPVLSAYGYGISASASNKKASILPLRSRTKRLGYSSSLQTASSNLKSSIIAALPKLSKSKKLISVSTGSQKTPVVEKKK